LHPSFNRLSDIFLTLYVVSRHTSKIPNFCFLSRSGVSELLSAVSGEFGRDPSAQISLPWSPMLQTAE
jgi:hypothetical protein